MEEIRNKDGLTEKEFLERYNPGDYPRPSVTTDMILFTVDNDYQLNVLLIQRKDHPYINKWALPGGFCNINESLEDCAKRELKEETGVDAYMEQLYTFSEPNRDPRMRVISTTFMALIPKDSVNVVAGDDAKDAKWFLYNNFVDMKMIVQRFENGEVIPGCAVRYLNSDKAWNWKWQPSVEDFELAFDHADQIYMAIQRLRNKIWYTTIAFNLLPEKFSLDEAQKVYEAILGTKINKQNFRTKIKKFIEETNEVQKGVAHRPSKLYRLRRDV